MHDTRIRDTNLESRWIPRTRLATGGGEQLPCRESCTVLCCAPARVFYFGVFTKNKETLQPTQAREASAALASRQPRSLDHRVPLAVSPVAALASEEARDSGG